MALPFAIVPKALNAKAAAEYLGLSERRFSAKVKDGKIRKQPDGAFSIKHLDEYQKRMEAAAECEVIQFEAEDGDVAREDQTVGDIPADSGGEKVVHQQTQRGGRGQASSAVQAAYVYPDL